MLNWDANSKNRKEKLFKFRRTWRTRNRNSFYFSQNMVCLMNFQPEVEADADKIDKRLQLQK